MHELKKEMLLYLLLSLLLLETTSFKGGIYRLPKCTTTVLFDSEESLSSADSIPSESLQLFGSSRTRSPLVNWFLLEKGIPFEQKPPSPSNHPFGQVPFLSDSHGEVQVFESGAILLYLADRFGYKCKKDLTPTLSPQERALYTKWVVWANSELDGLCFGKGMSGSMLDRPSKAMDTLNKILAERDWLVGNEMTVADIAIASYLNYVPIFFSTVNPSSRQEIVKYMRRTAERSAYLEAFGKEHTNLVIKKTQSWLK